MPFTERSMSFLLENRLMDSREWFKEHRDEYEENIVEPMAELFEALTPAMLIIDPEFICIPKPGKSIARLWRDTRMAGEKSIFREYIWFDFIREKYRGWPSYWFALSPSGCQWGCGWYYTSTATMKAIRQHVLEEDDLYKAAEEAYCRQKHLLIAGEKYKKSPYTQYPDSQRRWLEQRTIFLESRETVEGLFSPKLADRVRRDFKAVAPVYRLFRDSAVLWEY